MARSRKVDPTPSALGAVAPEDATLEERTQYLLHEIGKEARFLEQWIAHYLAELLKRVDHSKATPRARSEARTEIAQVVPALWEQQIAREALRVRQKVDYWLRRTDTLDSEAAQLLGPLIADPNSARNLSENEAPNAFRALHTLAELVTRFLVTIATAEMARSEVTSEAVLTFLQRDDEVRGLQAALARVVPDFAALNPTDPGTIEKLVHQTFLALIQAQFALLTRVAADAAPAPKVGKKAGKKGGPNPGKGSAF